MGREEKNGNKERENCAGQQPVEKEFPNLKKNQNKTTKNSPDGYDDSVGEIESETYKEKKKKEENLEVKCVRASSGQSGLNESSFGVFVGWLCKG